MAISLSKRNIPCVQTIKNKEDEARLRSLTSKAAAIYTDEDYTHWDRARIQRIIDVATVAVFLVDASRLIPTRLLPQNLKTTPEFRKAHGKLRDDYFALRSKTNQKELKGKITAKDLPSEHNFAHYDDAAIIELVKQLNLNQKFKISKEYPPTQAEITKRIATLKSEILAKYKWIRNNPALEYSTSQLSPYLHFGTIGPHRILTEIESTEIPKSNTYKFRDEFLTWREWFHYRAFYTPNLHEYDSLPDEARQTLSDHADDPRPDLCSFEDILQGNKARSHLECSPKRMVKYRLAT